MSNEFTMDDFNAMVGEIENEQSNGQFKSLYWKPSEGTTKIRVLTPLKQFNEKLFYQKHKMHYINNRAYFCLNQTLEDKNGNLHEAEACPICAKSKQLYNNSTKGTPEWDEAGKLRAKDRYVARVIVRGKKDKDGNDIETIPEFWEFGQKIHEYFFNVIKMGEYGNFLSLKDGRDYNLVKKGSGRSTNYDGSGLSPNQSIVFSDKDKLVKLSEEFPKMKYSQLVEFVSVDELKQALVANDSIEETTKVSNVPSGTDMFNDSLNPMSQSANEEKQDDIDDILNMI